MKPVSENSEAKNEVHLLTKTPPPAESRRAWLELEERLLSIAGQASTEADRGAVINLLSKGRSLFVLRSRKVSRSLGSAIAEFLASPLASSSRLDGELKDFYYRCFDEKERRKALLKDKLYTVVDFSSRRTHFLKDDFKRELLQREPDFIRSLPGHCDAQRRNTSWFADPTRYSETLESLLRRDVLGSFIFISRATREHPSVPDRNKLRAVPS